MSLGQRAETFTTRADLRYSAGGRPCTARKARLKSPGLEKPHLAAMAATGRGARAGSERSRRQHSSRRCRIQPATVRPSSWKSWCRERSEMCGVVEGAFAPPADIDNFTRRFIALLDGLALQRLQRMEGSSRKQLTELALYAARIELDPGAQGSPPTSEQA